ncbi:MAG: hypothetical protein WA021_02075 [Minisyncoccia bacterium]
MTDYTDKDLEKNPGLREIQACANYIRAKGVGADRITIEKHWVDPRTGKYIAFVGFHINGDDPPDKFIEKWLKK